MRTILLFIYHYIEGQNPWSVNNRTQGPLQRSTGRNREQSRYKQHTNYIDLQKQTAYKRQDKNMNRSELTIK